MSSHQHSTDETTQRSKDIIVITFLSIAAFFLTTFVVLNLKGYESPHKQGSERVISK
jgi:hypothetical protein